MHAINLTEFIQEGLLATQFANSKIFDAIIYADTLKPDTESVADATIYDKTDTQMDFGMSGALLALTEQHEKVLIIIAATPIVYMLPFLQYVPNNVVVINCGAGISGALTKGKPELNDIDLIYTTGVEIYEPSDGMQFFAQCLPQSDTKKYIRVPHLELPGSLEVSRQKDYTKILSSVENQKTMLVSGSLVGLFASALSDEQQGIMDLFTIQQYYTPFSADLIDSIEETKTLHCVLDMSATSAYIDFLKGQLYSMGIHGIDFSVVTPQRATKGTILPEYFWEEVSFS